MTPTKQVLTITAMLATALTSVPAAAQAMKRPEMKVEMVNTPITRTELVTVLRDGHVEAFGKAPTDSRLAMGWAQVAFENGQGKYSYDHNLGNIGPSSPDQPWYHSRIDGGFYRAFETFTAAAKRYWQVVGRCPGVLQRFDAGLAGEAARLLKGCGYFGADLDLYTTAMGSLFWTAWHTVIPQEKKTHEQRLPTAPSPEFDATCDRPFPW